MRTARFAMSGAAVGALLAAGLIAAPAASAAELSSACTNLNSTLIEAPLGEGDFTYGDDAGFATGDVLTLTFTLTAGSVTSIELRMLDPQLVEILAPDPFVTVASTSTVPGAIAYVIPADRAAPELVSLRIRVNGPGVVAATSDCRSAPEPAAPVPAWQQAYGRASQDADCADGWNPSWQEWALPVTGGWVCTRTVPAIGD